MVSLNSFHRIKLIILCLSINTFQFINELLLFFSYKQMIKRIMISLPAFFFLCSSKITEKDHKKILRNRFASFFNMAMFHDA